MYFYGTNAFDDSLTGNTAMMHQIWTAQDMSAKPEGNQLYSVKLIDSRTGEVPSLNGNRLSVLTRAPKAAVKALMQGRDRGLWRAEVEPVLNA